MNEPARPLATADQRLAANQPLREALLNLRLIEWRLEGYAQNGVLPDLAQDFAAALDSLCDVIRGRVS